MKRKFANYEKDRNKIKRWVRYTVDEFLFIEREAKRYGVTITHYIRLKSLNAPMSLIPPLSKVEL